MLSPVLETLGLTDKESKIYTLLLEIGEVPVHTLISKSRMKRATVYKSLYALESKELVSRKVIHKKLYFRPESPSKLTTLAEKQVKDIEKAQKKLEAILPELSNQYVLLTEKPVVAVFQGVEGLKKIYEDTLKIGEPIYAALTAKETHSQLQAWLDRTYVKERVRLKIPASVIVSTGPHLENYIKHDTAHLRETRLVQATVFPFPHEINIYGDKVAYIDYRHKGALIGVIVHHPQIASTMRSLWSLAWAAAEILGQDSKT